MSSLTAHQKKASEHFKGPALTLAIPGSGKTTLLLHRLVNLTTHHGIAPEHILTLTFSKASASDMKKRYASQFASLYPYRYPMMTIHKFAYEILKQYMRHTGKHMTLFDDAQKRFFVLQEIYRSFYHETLAEEDYEYLLNAIGLIYNLKYSESDVKGEDFKFEHMYAIFKAYHQYKRRQKVYDFDDMLLYALKILAQNKEALAFYQKQYPFIQVDEAQDTSKLQFELIELLAGPNQNLFLVADDDQSIYGFRGAFPQYLLDFPLKYKDHTLYHLPDNFRSDAHIVSLAEAIIKANKDRFDKPMNAIHPAEIKPDTQYFDDIHDRNAFLKKQLLSEKGNLAILYRNRIAALSIIDFLEQIDCNYYIKDPPRQELNHWLLSDIAAFMSLAMMPQDFDAFRRIVFKMNGFISKEMLNDLLRSLKQRSVFDLLIELPYLEDYQTRTMEGLKMKFESLSKLRPFDAIHFIETELGYLNYLNKNSERLGYSMQFIRTRLDAYKAIAKPLTSAIQFFSRIDTLKQHFEVAANNVNAPITLSTIHGAKGLEFDSVYLIDVNEHVFPSDDTRLIEEERRLFYVAITRAKKHFCICHANFINGGINKKSSFLDEFTVKNAL